jgi:formylglycine-generating enzyme required for sulfatase activity
VPVNLAGPEMTIGATWLYADGSLLVAVPAGIFTLGGGKLDNPPHPVNLPDFWIYRTKVTNLQYAYCVAIGACTPPPKAGR